MYTLECLNSEEECLKSTSSLPLEKYEFHVAQEHTVRCRCDYTKRIVWWWIWRRQVWPTCRHCWQWPRMVIVNYTLMVTSIIQPMDAISYQVLSTHVMSTVCWIGKKKDIPEQTSHRHVIYSRPISLHLTIIDIMHYGYFRMIFIMYTLTSWTQCLNVLK